ncbi:hypothetical protein BDW59DRAFT_158250 [Aspergillus cavernicola]|uniref:Cytochrome P450 n=1 Tax=Aspergillus cavernicola TaxID=176166 RepID=A0ABR4ISR6_9EURO
MLLTIVCDKLVSLSSKLVNFRPRGVVLDDKKNTLAEDVRSTERMMDDNSARGNMFVGDYEIDDPNEWSCILRVLFLLQLKQLRLLIREIKAVACNEIMNTQVAMLEHAERQVVQMMERARRDAGCTRHLFNFSRSTPLIRFYDVVKTGRYTRQVQQMHEKYGPIVRINPLEVHCNDHRFINKIYTGGIRVAGYQFTL